MIKIGDLYFPDFSEESARWQPVVIRVALDPHVLAVAVTRLEGRWSAYIAAVPGVRHDQEMCIPVREGTKLPEDVARLLFPMF